MNSIERIAGNILACAGDICRHMMCSTLKRIAARHLSHRRCECGEIERRRINRDRRLRARQAAMKNKQTEWITGGNCNRSDAKSSATLAHRADAETPARVRAQAVQHTADAMHGQFGCIIDFDPYFGQASGVVNEKAFFRDFAHLGAGCHQIAFQAKGRAAVHRKAQRDDFTSENQIGEAEKSSRPV